MLSEDRSRSRIFHILIPFGRYFYPREDFFICISTGVSLPGNRLVTHEGFRVLEDVEKKEKAVPRLTVGSNDPYNPAFGWSGGIHDRDRPHPPG